MILSAHDKVMSEKIVQHSKEKRRKELKIVTDGDRDPKRPEEARVEAHSLLVVVV